MDRILTGMLLAGALTLAANSFETAEDAAKVSGRVALDESTYRFGTHSLRWDARPGESITLALPLAESPRRELSFFLYNPAESGGKLEAVIGDPSRKCDYKFEIPLNFKYWRSIRIAPVEDLKPKTNRAAAEQVTLTYRGEKAVDLYFDALSPVGSWQRVGNFQLPFVNPKRPAMTQSDIPGNIFISEYRKLENRFAKAPPVSGFQRDAIRELRKRVRNWLTVSGLPAEDPLVAARHQIILSAAREALERYRSWDIRQVDGKYRFKSGPEPGDGYDNLWREMAAKTCFPLACAYSINFPGNEFYQKPEIRDAVVNILGLMRYQGFAEGADHNWHAMFVAWGLGQTLFLMPKELKAAGLFEDLRKAQLWYSRFNAFAIAPAKWSPPSADVLRTGMVDSLCSILTMDDADASIRLNTLKQILDEQLVITGGYGDLIKPDGSTFHHGQVAHAAYGPDGLMALATMAYLLRGTPYGLNPGRLAELHRALVTFDRQQQKFDTPAATNVRWAFYDAAARPLAPAYAYSLLLDPLDREIAAIFKRQFQESELVKSNFRFLNFSEGEGQFSAMRQAAAQADKIVREKVTPPHGAFNYYNSALLIHRRDNWMVAIRGFGKYAWDFEIGARNPKGYENKYCRFVSHGTLQIFGNGKNAAESGRVNSGWDFAHFPGATSLNLTPEALELPAAMGYGRTFNDAVLVGGGTIENRNSIYGFELRDPVNPDFTAFKSYHLSGNLVVALGTDIKNDQDKVETDTTLFQNYLAAEGPDPSLKQYDGKKAVILTDNNRCAYYIPPGQKLIVSKAMQKGPNDRGDAVGSGYFEKAILRHGRAPKDGRYEYAVRINATPAEISALRKGKLPYEVLRADNQAHVVNFIGDQLWSAMVIKPGAELPGPAPVKSISIPGLVLCQKDRSESRWTVSVTDPDLGFTKPAAELGPKDYPVARVVTMELRGDWKAETGNVRIEGARAEITLLPGASEEFVLSAR